MSEAENSPCIAGTSPIRQEMAPGIYAYCTCGYSSNQPFCDGSHAGTSFEPLLVKIDNAQRISWCACKRSARQPYCDGAHKKLKEPQSA